MGFYFFNVSFSDIVHPSLRNKNDKSKLNIVNNKSQVKSLNAIGKPLTAKEARLGHIGEERVNFDHGVYDTDYFSRVNIWKYDPSLYKIPQQHAMAIKPKINDIKIDENTNLNSGRNNDKLNTTKVERGGRTTKTSPDQLSRINNESNCEQKNENVNYMKSSELNQQHEFSSTSSNNKYLDPNALSNKADSIIIDGIAPSESDTNHDGSLVLQLESSNDEAGTCAAAVDIKNGGKYENTLPIVWFKLK